MSDNGSLEGNGRQTQSFHWHGHRLELLPERAVWDRQQGLLLLADVHLGKAECLQAHGVPVPSDGDTANLETLLELAHRLQPSAVVVLGDLIHGPQGLTRELRQKLAALPELLGCPLRLIDGHENGLTPEEWLDAVTAMGVGAAVIWSAWGLLREALAQIALIGLTILVSALLLRSVEARSAVRVAARPNVRPVISTGACHGPAAVFAHGARPRTALALTAGVIGADHSSAPRKTKT